MKIDYHIRIDNTKDMELFITSGQKLITSNLATIDNQLLAKVTTLLEKLEKQLVQEAQNSGYEVTPRTSLLFPVPDHL